MQPWVTVFVSHNLANPSVLANGSKVVWARVWERLFKIANSNKRPFRAIFSHFPREKTSYLAIDSAKQGLKTISFKKHDVLVHVSQIGVWVHENKCETNVKTTTKTIKLTNINSTAEIQHWIALLEKTFDRKKRQKNACFHSKESKSAIVWNVPESYFYAPWYFLRIAD